MAFKAEDRGDHYVIDEGDGPFRLDKAGLDEAVALRVRASIAAPPKMASGGIVPVAPLPLPMPGFVRDFYKSLYRKDEKEEQKPDDRDEKDAPDAGEPQALADGGVVEDDDGDKPRQVIRLPEMDVSGGVEPQRQVIRLPEMDVSGEPQRQVIRLPEMDVTGVVASLRAADRDRAAWLALTPEEQTQKRDADHLKVLRRYDSGSVEPDAENRRYLLDGLSEDARRAYLSDAPGDSPLRERHGGTPESLRRRTNTTPANSVAAVQPGAVPRTDDAAAKADVYGPGYDPNRVVPVQTGLPGSVAVMPGGEEIKLPNLGTMPTPPSGDTTFTPTAALGAASIPETIVQAAKPADRLGEDAIWGVGGGNVAMAWPDERPLGRAPPYKPPAVTRAPPQQDQVVPDTGIGQPQRPLTRYELGGGGSSSYSLSAPGAGSGTPEFEADPIFAEAQKKKEESLQRVAEVDAWAGRELSKVAEAEGVVARAAEERVRALSERYLGAAQRMADDLTKARVDPNRFYQSLSTGQRVSAVASIIMGGLGATLQGIGRGGSQGRNVGMALLQRAVDQDIQSQKDNIENQHSVMRALVQQGHDAIDAEKIATGLAMNAAASQLKVIQAQAGADRAGAALGGIISDAEMQAAKLIRDGISQDVDTWSKKTLTDAQVGNYRRTIESERQAAQAAAQAAQDDEDLFRAFLNREATIEHVLALRHDKEWSKRTFQIPAAFAGGGEGKWTLLKSSEMQKEASEIMAGAMSYKDIVEELLQYAKMGESAVNIPGINNRIKALVTNGVIAKIKASKMGAYDRGVETLFSTTSVDPSALFQLQSHSLEVLEAERDTLTSNVTNYINEATMSPRAGATSSRRSP